MDKASLIKHILNELEIKLEAALAEAQSSKEAATHEESKPENKYDTRGLEATYIAQAQAKRAGQIKEDIYNISQVDLEQKNEKVSAGSLIKILYNKQNKEVFYFVLPSGGITIEAQSQIVKSLSVSSPLGQCLLNREEGDEAVFRGENIELLLIQ
jgi:transcription elongation GreA/GreB family factor